MMDEEGGEGEGERQRTTGKGGEDHPRGNTSLVMKQSSHESK